MSPGNKPLWHIHFFELKELKKTAGTRKTHPAPPFSSWKQEIKFPRERCSPCTRRKEDILITRNGEFRAEKAVCVNKSCQTLIFLVTSSPLTTPNPYTFVLSVLRKLIFPLSKRYKSLLLWSLLWFFILLWMLPWTCKYSRKCACFSLPNLSLSV